MCCMSLCFVALPLCLVCYSTKTCDVCTRIGYGLNLLRICISVLEEIQIQPILLILFGKGK